MLAAAEAQQAKQALEKEHSRLMAQFAQLAQMAATNMKNSNDLTTMSKADQSAKSNALGAKTTDGSAIGSGRSVASLETKAGKTGLPIALDEKTALGAKEAGEAGAKAGTSPSKGLEAASSLRKRLRDKLASKTALDATDPTKRFEGNLMGDGGMLTADEEEAPVAVTGKDTSAITRSALQAAEEHFSMSGSETAQEVNRLTEEVSRDLASLTDTPSGVLGSESRSLFERVKRAHDSCVKQSCVATSMKH